MKLAVLTLIMSFCTQLHGPDLYQERNYDSYACTDQLKTCVKNSTIDPKNNEQVGVCIGKYVKKNYRKRR